MSFTYFLEAQRHYKEHKAKTPFARSKGDAISTSLAMKCSNGDNVHTIYIINKRGMICPLSSEDEIPDTGAVSCGLKESPAEDSILALASSTIAL